MSLKQFISTGTKVWLDSIDPKEVKKNRAEGATGATSNPIIIADIIKAGGFDEKIAALADEKSDADIAWKLNDQMVRDAQQVFLPVWEQTKGNDGYVSFEVDPLLEDISDPKILPHRERVKKYVELAKKWSAGQKNRMIKIPATDAGIGAMEEVAAAGITINVTLIFSQRQYLAAREAIWKGAQRRAAGLAGFKSVYSIFVSRVDIYTEKYVPTLSKDAQGKVGIVNVKKLWKMNQEFWKGKNLPLQQEIIFASTGKKLAWQGDDYYVEALAGSDIQTNPPATNDFLEKSTKQYTRQIDKMPADAIVREIEEKVSEDKLEKKLMEEGTEKFATPQKALQKLIGEKRATLVSK